MSRHLRTARASKMTVDYLEDRRALILSVDDWLHIEVPQEEFEDMYQGLRSKRLVLVARAEQRAPQTMRPGPTPTPDESKKPKRLIDLS